MSEKDLCFVEFVCFHACGACGVPGGFKHKSDVSSSGGIQEDEQRPVVRLLLSRLGWGGVGWCGLVTEVGEGGGRTQGQE